MSSSFSSLETAVDTALAAVERYLSDAEGLTAGTPGTEATDELDAEPLGLRTDIVILRQKYQAVSEYLEELDRAANWVELQLQILGQSPSQPSIEEILDRTDGMLKKMMEPSPSRILVQADLEAAKSQLGASYAEAIRFASEAYLASWQAVEVARLADNEKELNSTVTFPVSIFASLVRLHMVAANHLLSKITRSIERAQAGKASSERAESTPGAPGTSRSRKSRRKRPPLLPRKLTTKQAEAVQIVGECKGNIAEAAKRLGRDRSTVDQHYQAAMKKLGKSAVKHATTPLPADRRGQANIVKGQDRRV